MKGSDGVYDHVAGELPKEHRELIELVPIGGTWRDIPPHRLPDRFRGIRRTDGSNLLGRLDPALPSYTVTTQFNNVTTGAFTHPYEDRALSLREGARLQSFPDRFRFFGSRDSRYRQIGNAVPPRLAQTLGVSIAEAVLSAKSASSFRLPQRLRTSKDQAPPPSSKAARDRLRKQGKTDTKPEVLIRKELHRRGWRYRVDTRPMPDLRRVADIVFSSAKLAVFVDGCFWHGCPSHSRETKSNTKWWADKIAANKERDADTIRRLAVEGWQSVRVWEHEDPKTAAARIAALLTEAEGQAEAS